MAQVKQGWDTRTWLVGLLGSVACGGVMAYASSPLATRINAAAHASDAAIYIFEAAAVLNLLVLPTLLSGIAQRRTFLWGLLPFALNLTISAIALRITNGLTYGIVFSWLSLAQIAGGWMITSGPVSLFRWLRARRRRNVVPAALQAQAEAAAVPSKGVWPPPPDYRP